VDFFSFRTKEGIISRPSSALRLADYILIWILKRKDQKGPNEIRFSLNLDEFAYHQAIEIKT